MRDPYNVSSIQRIMSKFFRKPIVKTGMVVLLCLLVYDLATAYYVKNYVNAKGEETSGFSGFSGGLSRVG